MIISRGEIVLASLEPAIGSEQGKTRPCLIIQNDKGNMASPTTIIAAITSQAEKEYPFTVRLKKGEGNLPKESMVLCNQIRTISIQGRIIKKIGALGTERMKIVDEALKTSLGID